MIIINPGLIRRKGRIQMRRFFKTILVLVLCLFLTGCNKENKQKEILVGAAASLKPVMEELQVIYQDSYPEVSVNFSFGGSGTLEQQIREGAPIDVFISAAEKQMKALAKDGLIQEDSKVDLLINKLVLIVPENSELEIEEFEDIIEASSIALGDPASVPVGQYAEEVFDYLKITEEVHTKAIYGKDVTEVLTWVSSGNVDAGVVYVTDAISNDKVRIAAYAPENSHSKIIYPAAVLKASKEKTAAQSFLDFLMTKEAKDCFSEYGFEEGDGKN